MYFYLKEPNANKETPIIIQYYVKNDKKTFKYTTGEKIHPKDWSFESRLPIVKKGPGGVQLKRITINITSYNDYLEKIISNIELNNETVTIERLKNEFDRHFRGKTTTSKRFKYFVDFIDDFVLVAPELINKSTKKLYNLDKIKHYKKTANRLREFEFKHGKLEIQKIDRVVYDKVVDYFFKNKYAVNTIGDYIKNIKVLLKKAIEFGYVVNDDYKEFSVLREEVESIALSEAEINSIFNHDFSALPHLENCRDLAIIGFWTGLRVSDFMKLPKINPNEKFITVQPQKTKDSSGIKVVIPLHHHIKEVINTRGMPHSISDVKFNKYIKTVCEEVGLNEMTLGSLMDPDEKRKKVSYYEKYKLVASHTCRRSFATNLYLMNFPTLSIMKITGHTSEKSFLKYIKVTPTEHAQKLLEHWEMYYAKK